MCDVRITADSMPKAKRASGTRRAALVVVPRRVADLAVEMGWSWLCVHVGYTGDGVGQEAWGDVVEGIRRWKRDLVLAVGLHVWEVKWSGRGGDWVENSGLWAYF